jgi:DNA-binding response OmpR family regulator
MEGMDGIEVVMNIREIDTDVKIAVISGGGRLEADHYLRMMKALGVDLTLEKPIDLRELGECVKDLIG